MQVRLRDVPVMLVVGSGRPRNSCCWKNHLRVSHPLILRRARGSKLVEGTFRWKSVGDGTRLGMVDHARWAVFLWGREVQLNWKARMSLPNSGVGYLGIL